MRYINSKCYHIYIYIPYMDPMALGNPHMPPPKKHLRWIISRAFCGRGLFTRRQNNITKLRYQDQPHFDTLQILKAWLVCTPWLVKDWTIVARTVSTTLPRLIQIRCEFRFLSICALHVFEPLIYSHPVVWYTQPFRFYTQSTHQGW